MGTRKTLLSHFWNEEYLLPWWIKHHREMFDDAILIDWHSTDRSVHEIRKHAPSGWKVVKTRHKVPMDDDECFATALDAEVIEHESGVEGWRMCLNTTEFLVGSIGRATAGIEGERQLMVGCLQMLHWDPMGEEGALDWNQPLWKQRWMGIDCRKKQMMDSRPPRSLHNYAYRYGVGRHFWGTPEENLSKDLVILHYANCISSQDMLKRRLQIQQRISRGERARNFGVQHYGAGGVDLTADDLGGFINSRIHLARDMRPIVDEMLG